MRRLRVNVHMDEYNKVLYHRDFDVMETLPEIGDMFHGDEVKKIKPVSIDRENRDEVFDYDYFLVETDFNGEYEPDEDLKSTYYVAVEKPEEEPTEAELLAEKMYSSDAWEPEDCKRLCGLAGMEKEWEEADGESFEKVVYKAAYQLGVAV